MAAPKNKNVKNLNGVWVMNKTISDPTDPILALQGVGWLTRKAIGLMTLTLIVTESTDANGTVHIDISQLAGPGLTGTKEKRHIPPNGEKEWRDHEDHIFGHVKGVTTWINLSDLSDTDEHERFLKQDWVEAGGFLDSYVESQGNGWTARQVWGFATVNGEYRHVRRVVVRKGDKFIHARLVYDFKGEHRE